MYYFLAVDSTLFATAANLYYYNYSTFINNVLAHSSVYSFDSLLISEPNELISAISSQSINNCFGDCDASELISISGGVPPYSLNNVVLLQSDTLLDSLCAGNYVVNISDTNGCQASNMYSSFVVYEPPLITSIDSAFSCSSFVWNAS